MWRLTALRRFRQMRGRLQTGQAGQRSDRGAVAVLVAVVLVPVLLGISAIAVDGSMLYAGRRQVQTGADSAALAVAQACAQSSAACTPGTAGDLNALVKENVDLGDADVQSVCIQGPSLADCAGPSPARLPDCPISLPSKANGVVVRTQTQLDLVFARLLKDAKDKANVGACASVAWGSPGKMTAVLPFTVSQCEFDQATLFDPVTHPTRVYPTAETGLALKYKNGGDCSEYQGRDYDGGFGWLDHDACTNMMVVNGWIKGTPGGGKGSDCDDAFDTFLGQDVYLPIYSCVANTTPSGECPKEKANGSHANYRIAGFAAFHLSGYDLPAVGRKTSPEHKSSVVCTGNGGHCIFGWFLRDVVSAGEISADPNTPDFGLRIVTMVG